MRLWQVKTVCRLILVLSLLWAGRISAEEKFYIGGLDGLNPLAETSPLRIRLAISGGGARGISSVGVLRAFEENGIEITAIAGTSFGAIVGGLYACGYNSNQLTDIIHRVDTRALMSTSPDRSAMFLTKRQSTEGHLLSVRFDGLRPQIPKGWTAGQEVTSLLTRFTNRAVYQAGGDFSKLPIPFKTVGTDLMSGQRAVLDKGSLAHAMRATIAFPLAFTPVELDDRVLMDGGMVAPIPVDIVREMGDSLLPVVAINTTSPRLPREKLLTPVDLAGQVTTIMTADRLADQLALADLVIEPCPDEFTSTDFKYADSLIAIGYDIGLAAAAELIRLDSIRAPRLSQTVAAVEVYSDNRPLADRITASLHGESFTSDELLANLVATTKREHLLSLEVGVSPQTAETPGDQHGRQAVTLRLVPVEGVPMTDSTLIFEGNYVLSDDELRSAVIIDDPIIDAVSVRLVQASIERAYRARGYDLARAVKLIPNSRNNQLRLVIDEAAVLRIDVRNNERSRDWLIRSYFTLEPGEPFSTQKASRGIENIYATDLFERVALDLVPSPEGVIARISVVEKKYSQLRLGWHWHDEYESEQYLEFLDDNLLGIGAEFLTHAQYGNNRGRFFASLRTHRIFSTYLTAHTRAFYQTWERTLFDNRGEETGFEDQSRYGVSFGVGQQIARLGTVNGELRFERVKLENHQSGSSEEFGLSSMSIRSLVETFDRIPFPKSGKKHYFEITLAGKAFGGDFEYTRFHSSVEAYFPFGPIFNYHPKLVIGISRTGLPNSEKFYLGGRESLYGYRSDQLSGDKLILISNEVRARLPLHFYLLVRYDAGEVFMSADQIKLKSLRNGLGIALAVATPIGPFEVGYGTVESDADRVYFSAGFEF